MRFGHCFIIAGALALVASCADGSDTADSSSRDQARDGTGDLDCGVGGGVVQIDGGVGVLRIGVSADEVRRRCRVVRDTTVLDNEGMPVPRLMVALTTDTAVAETVNDSVWRLRLTAERFWTSSGLGVGSTVRELAEAGQARALVGEGEVYVTIPAVCGVSYRIAGADFARVARASSPERAMATLPDTARVDLVLVFRCSDAGAPQ